MRRSALLCVAIGVGVFAAACSSDDQKPGPMEPPVDLAPVTGDQPDLTLRCRNHGLIVVQLGRILSPRPPARLFQKAVQQFAMVEVALLTRKKPLAQARALALIGFLADNRDNLINANTPTTLTRLGNVTDAILCIVGLQPTGVVLGPNTGIGVVPANNPEPVIIRTPQGDAGLRVPEGGAPSEDVNGNPIPGVVVTVTGLGTNDTLATMLDKYGQTVDLTASQEVLWLEGGVTVAICVAIEDDVLFDAIIGRLRMGHEGGVLPRFGAIEILPPAATGDVTAVVGACGPSFGSRPAFEGLRQLAARVFLPEPLHATAAAALKTGGVGGTTRKFSKFGAVDPELDVIAQPTSTSGTAGEPVEQPPSVLIRTKTLSTPIEGIEVGFEVGEGGGTIAPAEDSTGSDGVAATTSWVLGAGENTVIATPVEPVTEINFTPSSVTFTAEGTGTIDYRSPGYRFIRIGSTPPSEGTDDYPGSQWFLPEFTPSSAWGTGGAPFGDPGAGCSIFGSSPVVTTWEASEVEATQADSGSGTALLVRKTFTTPVGFEGEVLVHVAIDNDIQVYVDGTDITNHESVNFFGQNNTDVVNGSWAEFTNGFQPHLGCAQQNDGTFTVPGSLLDDGTTHVIAIYAHDWGGASYLDIQVEFDTFD